MKTITNYINDHLYEPDFIKESLQNKYHYIIEYFNNNIPEYIETNILSDIHYDYITEFLKSVDNNFVIKQLEKIGCKCIKQSEHETNKKWFTVTSDFVPTENNIFLDIIDKFRYQIHKVMLDGGKYVTILDPIIANKANDEIETKFHNKLYHITKKNIAEQILKHGLRTRYSKYDNILDEIKSKKQNSKIDQTSRVYLFTINSNKDIDKVANELHMNNSNYCVLEITLPTDLINVYKDTKMNSDNCYFCYNTIPAKYIKIKQNL